MLGVERLPSSGATGSGVGFWPSNDLKNAAMANNDGSKREVKRNGSCRKN